VGLIEALACEPSPKVFLLWGAQAQSETSSKIGARARAATRFLLANHPFAAIRARRRGPVAVLFGVLTLFCGQPIPEEKRGAAARSTGWRRTADVLTCPRR